MHRPFLINVGEELRHPGTLTSVVVSGAVPGVDLSSSRITDDTDVYFDGTVEAQGTTVVVQGEARAAWEGECRRCLEPTGGEIRVALREIFEPEPAEGETFPLDDEQIDLEPVLREALALALPAAPLCAEDCAGPDPEAHPVGGLGESARTDVRHERDPRWAALDQLRIDR